MLLRILCLSATVVWKHTIKRLCSKVNTDLISHKLSWKRHISCVAVKNLSPSAKWHVSSETWHSEAVTFRWLEKQDAVILK